uniref:Uncharacterized protein n=1 Tax=Glossina pallidipes TaxID=7398 RepID=A0A1A9ZBS5_GLOPL
MSFTLSIAHRHLSQFVCLSTSRKNYYQALQSLGDSEAEIIVNKAACEYVLPITVLKCNIEQIHQLCKSVKIDDFSTRKISIGLKTSWSRKNGFDVICDGLDIKKLEFFTYTNLNLLQAVGTLMA